MVEKAKADHNWPEKTNYGQPVSTSHLSSFSEVDTHEPEQRALAPGYHLSNRWRKVVRGIPRSPAAFP
jgi:hypothetical protein